MGGWLGWFTTNSGEAGPKAIRTLQSVNRLLSYPFNNESSRKKTFTHKNVQNSYDMNLVL